MRVPVENGPANKHAWLVRVKGLGGPAWCRLRGTVTRVGRDPENDIVIETSTTSSHHSEISWEHGSCWTYDLNSANGTYVNGNCVDRAPLEAESRIRFGTADPEFAFKPDKRLRSSMDETVVLTPVEASREEEIAPQSRAETTPSITTEDEKLLSDAVRRAREARRNGSFDQTQTIMRAMLGLSKSRSDRRWRLISRTLMLALLAVAGLGYWKVQDVRENKTDLDRRIEQIEMSLVGNGLDDSEVDKLMWLLDDYQRQAQALQNSLLFRWGILGEEQLFVQREVRTVLRRFGAESYSVPPEFVERVSYFIEQFQTRDREHVERVMAESQADLQLMQRIFEEAKLPGDLAYMAMVESAFLVGSRSRQGAAGPWQFHPATARQYGLRVSQDADDRYDIEKSTRAANRYIRKLILDFGVGSSVMLALTAYNVGPGKVRRAVRKVEDPIKQRNFWYLYRTRALPTETREYVPKIFAAILIGRNPESFGF